MLLACDTCVLFQRRCTPRIATMFAIRTIIACSLVAGLAGGAHATILFDNTGVTQTTTPDGLSSDGPQYNSFTTDTSGVVNTISLLLDNGGAPNTSGMTQ